MTQEELQRFVAHHVIFNGYDAMEILSLLDDELAEFEFLDLLSTDGFKAWLRRFGVQKMTFLVPKVLRQLEDGKKEPYSDQVIKLILESAGISEKAGKGRPGDVDKDGALNKSAEDIIAELERDIAIKNDPDYQPD